MAQEIRADRDFFKVESEILDRGVWMLENLRDPAIQAVLVIAGIIVAILIYWKQRKHKSLGYEVLSCIPLSSVDPRTLWSYQQAGLQFTFKGKNIPQGHFISIKFTNTGNVPIKRDDYDAPISLGFGEKAKVLAWRWVEKKPETIDLGTLKFDETGKTTIDPTLLNSKDSFVIEMLVSGFDSQVRIGGRIVGVKEIKDMRGGLPISREEGLVEEALVVNIFIFLFAIISEAYFVAIIAFGVLILQVWRKLIFKSIRKFERESKIT